jgi:hypothetical protein
MHRRDPPSAVLGLSSILTPSIQRTIFEPKDISTETFNRHDFGSIPLGMADYLGFPDYSSQGTEPHKP